MPSWREDNERLLRDVFGAISAQLWVNNTSAASAKPGLIPAPAQHPPNFPVHPLSALFGYFDIRQDLQFRLDVVSGNPCSGFLLILPSFTKDKAMPLYGLNPSPGSESSCSTLFGVSLGWGVTWCLCWGPTG